MNNYGNATQAKCQGLVWSYEPEEGLIQHPTATKANLFESRWTPNDHKTRNNFSLKETFFPTGESCKKPDEPFVIVYSTIGH